MNDYKELIEALRICSNNRLKDNAYFNMVSAADAIEQLVKERDAYAKCFRIKRTDEELANHAVFKIDYGDIIDKTADELVHIIAFGLARAVRSEVSE